MFGMCKIAFKEQSALAKILLVGCACYLLNLKWVDSLQTLKYLYVMFAIYLAIPKQNQLILEKEQNKKLSKYIRREC